MKKSRKQAEKSATKLDQVCVQAPTTKMVQATYEDCSTEQEGKMKSAGSRLDAFNFLQIVGSGAFGKVFKVRISNFNLSF